MTCLTLHTPWSKHSSRRAPRRGGGEPARHLHATSTLATFLTLLLRRREGMRLGLEEGRQLGLQKGYEIGRRRGAPSQSAMHT